MMMFLQISSRSDVVLMLVPAVVAVSGVLLVSDTRLVVVDVVGNSGLRTRSNSWRRVGLRCLSADGLCRLVHCNTTTFHS